jgi:DNA invertase Pin-like site-specific DNA recombinase
LLFLTEAQSGAAITERGALQYLLKAARMKPCPFDCVLVEDTSRMARDLPDALRITETLGYYGVAVVSITQGIDSSQTNARQLITLNGMVDEQYLIGLRDKVHRGQQGRVLSGMIPGGRCYGYRNVPIEDPTRTGKYGRPAVRGVQAEIEEAEANVVRQIFQMYADGMGLAQIAIRLNREGVASPAPAKNRLRQAWSRYTIREMLHNERYRGVLVWDRTKKVRNPETRRKVSKARPESEWTRVDAPALRIVPEALWLAAHQRNAQVNALGITRLGGLCRTQRSRTYLFSGLLGCGRCGSNMVIISGGGKRGYVKYGCHTHKHTGTCDNCWTIRRDRLEEQLLAAIEQRVLRPEVVDYLVRRCREELHKRLKEMERQGATSSLDGLRKQQSDLRCKAARLAEAVELGGNLPTLIQRLRTVEAEIERGDQAIKAFRPVKTQLTEETIRERVLNAMMMLRSMLSATDLTLAKNALLKHVRRLVLTPTVKDGRKLFQVSGQVSLVPEGPDGGMLLVARDGHQQHYSPFSIPLTDLYLDPRLDLR